MLGFAFVSGAAAHGLAPAKETLEQLDKLLPLEDRKKCVALAIAKAKAVPPPAAKAAAKPKAGAKPAKAAAAKPPEPKAAVRQAAPVSGAWRVQLGAFSQRSSAEALYRKVSGSAPLSGRSPFYVAAGSVTRLQVGPFASRAEAQAACSALKGQACFPVAAK